MVRAAHPRAPFRWLFHADWSVAARGRWAARAERVGQGWRAEPPFPVASHEAYRDALFEAARTGPTLAGFDFPIGLPAGYCERAGLAEFPAALGLFGSGTWDRFYEVAATPAEIGPRRPFYPARPGAARRRHLLDGHAAVAFADLMRRCDRGGDGQRAAGCLFWTLGSAQVGKAALDGWRHLVAPARLRGARLWPFDGDLPSLADGGLTLAETYPADAYAVLGARFGPRESKRRQRDRAAKAPALLGWAERASVGLAPALREEIETGFGPQDKGGDRFDAVAGLFGMIVVVDGQRAAGAPDDAATRLREGWILGRQPDGPAERFRG